MKDGKGKPIIIFATSNPGKMKEVRMLLNDLNVTVRSMEEAGVQADIVEDGDTFEKNAAIKAEAIRDLTGCIALADDSGLEIDYLNGEPGVYSARYMGEDTSYTVKNRAIIEKLANAKGAERSARFVCVIAAAFPGQPTVYTKGIMEGIIADEPSGEGGFGYDPIFYVQEIGTTTAQMSPEGKNAISHRGKALREMKKKLISLLDINTEVKNENFTC